ncbi:MAG: hypothetical protein QXZ09_09890, partial [Candidatus Methanomethylicaceae archaeon]
MSIKGLLEDLLELRKEPGISGLHVVMLENSNKRVASLELRQLVEQFRAAGLRLYLIDRNHHVEDAKHCLVLDGGASQGNKLTIDAARTVLQSYLYALASKRPGAVVAIFDDDMRFKPLVIEDKRLVRKWINIVPTLQRLRETGIDIAIGEYTGAAPLPFASTVRVQLVDLLASILWLSKLSPDQPLSDNIARNLQLRKDRRDFYYDLSREETDRLETPFLIEPAKEGETVAEAFIRLSEKCFRILAGEQVFRPLAINPCLDPIRDMREGLQRGGITFIFNIEALRDVPNPVPSVDGRPTRRSDMIWALLQERHFKRQVVRVPIGLYHDRSNINTYDLKFDCLVDDIRGYALFSALKDKLTNGGSIEAASERVTKYLEERFAAFQLSFHRIRGATKAIRAAISKGWFKEEIFQKYSQRILDFCEHLDKLYTPYTLHKIEKAIYKLTPKRTFEFLRNLSSIIEQHKERMKNHDKLANGLNNERLANAKATAIRLAGVPAQTKMLGSGAEGVVLTDGQLVYKVFDYWKARNSKVQRTFLKECVGKWPNAQYLYPLKSLYEEGPDAVLVYPYEESEPSRGGYGPGILNLLVECHRYG